MPSAKFPTLPPELWIAIFEEVIESSISPADQCDYITFPDISNRLYSPWEHRPRELGSLRNLRLVCREFSGILQTSPHIFMEDGAKDIPIGARAVYFPSLCEPTAILQQLLAHPSKLQRIIALDIPLLNERHSSHLPLVFNGLNGGIGHLPALRSLTLDFFAYRGYNLAITKFWVRLHQEFPDLTCLVLRRTYGRPLECNPVKFEKLEVLSMTAEHTNSNVNFPAIRHLAIGKVRIVELAQFAGGGHLESLLIKDIHPGAPFEWGIFPRLRLLGFPRQRVEDLDPLPPSHPLQHLYIYVETTERNDHTQTYYYQHRELTWFKRTIGILPTITQITLEFPQRVNGRVPWLSGHFDDDNLASTGFTVNYVGSEPRLLVMDRTPRPPQNPDPEKRGFKAGWKKFRRSASGKLDRVGYALGRDFGIIHE